MTMFIGRSYADAFAPVRWQSCSAPTKTARISCWWIRAATTPSSLPTSGCPSIPAPTLPGACYGKRAGHARPVRQEIRCREHRGFDQWAKELEAYPPSWAEKVTGIRAETIDRLAVEFAQAAPALPSTQLARRVRLLVRELR